MADENKDINKDSKNNESDKEVFFYQNYNKSKKSNSQSDISNIKKTGKAQRMAKNRPLSKKRIAFNIAAIIMGVIMIVAGSGCMVAYCYFNRINYQVLDDSKPEVVSNTSSQTKSDVSSTASAPIVEPYNGDLLNDPMVLNIMIFGDDRRNADSKGNSDTMILLSIDTRNKKIKMSSFLRDTWLSIPGHGDDRLNAAYPIGGASLAVQTIESNYGIHIDRYAIIDFTAFTSIIDTLGGIDIELTDEEIDYINWQCWKNKQVETRDELDRSSYTFHENKNGEMVTTVHLNSRQALWHARNRGEDGICSGDDFTRTQRQRNVVSIIINDLKNSDFATILSTIYAIGPMITTNLKTSEITSLASNMMKYLKYDIVSESFPARDAIGTDYYFDTFYPNGQKKDVICIYDWNDFRRKVAEFVFGNSVKTVSETTSN